MIEEIYESELSSQRSHPNHNRRYHGQLSNWLGLKIGGLSKTEMFDKPPRPQISGPAISLLQMLSRRRNLADQVNQDTGNSAVT